MGTPSIIRLTLAGTSSVFATAGLNNTAWSEAFDSTGNLFVTLRNGSVVKYTPAA
ncbi:MAG: hypothetical protein INR62_06555 [Rhodospirillales bacterium]|nr:hypothetical protein [Acetobacter sp.]